MYIDSSSVGCRECPYDNSEFKQYIKYPKEIFLVSGNVINCSVTNSEDEYNDDGKRVSFGTNEYNLLIVKTIK